MFYEWKSKLEGMEISKTCRRLRLLEGENARWKEIGAQQALNMQEQAMSELDSLEQHRLTRIFAKHFPMYSGTCFWWVS
jgi:hypothetical protein